MKDLFDLSDLSDLTSEQQQDLDIFVSQRSRRLGLTQGEKILGLFDKKDSLKFDEILIGFYRKYGKFMKRNNMQMALGIQVKKGDLVKYKDEKGNVSYIIKR